MADVAADIYHAQPGTVDTLLYTNADANPMIIKSINVMNTTGSAATLTLGTNAGGALAVANYLCPVLTIPPNTLVVIEPNEIIAVGETIRALQGTSGALTVKINGVRQT